MFSLFIDTIKLPSQDLFSVEFQLHANYKIDYCPLITGAVSLFYQRCKQIIRNIEDPISLKKIQNPYETGPYPVKSLLSAKDMKELTAPAEKPGFVIIFLIGGPIYFYVSQ